jgi:hypothetical protein
VNNRGSHQSLASFEPEEEDGDVHSACTAVANLPDSFLDDLKRGKADDPTTARYKVLPEADLEGNDAPTLPPPDHQRTGTRVRELNDKISAALAAAAAAPPVAVVTPPPAPLPEVPIPEAPIVVAGIAAPPDLWRSFVLPAAQQRRHEDQWLTFAVGVAFVVSLLALAVAVVFSL